MVSPESNTTLLE